MYSPMVAYSYWYHIGVAHSCNKLLSTLIYMYRQAILISIPNNLRTLLTVSDSCTNRFSDVTASLHTSHLTSSYITKPN